MGLLAIFFVLILGYYYTSNYLPSKVILKRSAGWEAYVHLGKHGLSYMAKGLMAMIILMIFAWFAGLALNVFFAILGFDSSIDLTQYLGIDFLGIGIKPYMILTVILSFYLCKADLQEKSDKETQYAALKSIDSILNIVLEASETQTPVKISLKSKKIYVGLIDGEQFEHADLDSISIIPYLSGYRDKDTLEVCFNCNYMNVYDEHEITSLRDFRAVIRVAEVESISLFDINMYDEFQN